MKFAHKMAVASLIFSIITTSGMVSYISMANAGEIEKEKTIDNLEDISIDDDQEEMSDEWLRIPLPSGYDRENIIIEKTPEGGLVSISLAGVEDAFLHENSLTGNSSHISGLAYGHEEGTARLLIYLDGLYEAVSEFDDESNKLKLKFVKPHEIYKKVIIIDPGHGGDNLGTYANGVCEKNVDMSLAFAVADAFSDSDVGVYFSRKGDECATLDTIEKLIDESDADFLFSIHCMGDTATRTTCGESLFYSSNTSASKDAAMVIGEGMGIDTDVIEVSDISYVNELLIPAVVYSPGYLTNKADANMMSDEAEISRIANEIKAGIEAWLAE